VTTETDMNVMRDSPAPDEGSPGSDEDPDRLPRYEGVIGHSASTVNFSE